MKKYFCDVTTFFENQVAQFRKVSTTNSQFFKNSCVRVFDERGDVLRDRRLLFCSGQDSLGTIKRDSDVTENDLANTFLGGRTVAKKKKSAAKKAPKKRAKKSKKKK